MPQIDVLHQLVDDIGASAALRLIHMFQKDVDKHIAFLQEYLENSGPTKDIRFHSHTLKGLCRTYGATVGGEAAYELQNACDQGDANAIRNATQNAVDIIVIDAKAAVSFIETLTKDA